MWKNKYTIEECNKMCENTIHESLGIKLTEIGPDFIKGTMPVTKSLPNNWYNTPNIHMCTIKDFVKFSEIIGFKIFKSLALKNKNISKINNSNLFFKNLFGELGIFLIEK